MITSRPLAATQASSIVGGGTNGRWCVLVVGGEAGMCSSSTRDTTEVLFELERWRADASGVCNDCPDHSDEVPLNTMADVVACVVVGNVGGC